LCELPGARLEQKFRSKLNAAWAPASEEWVADSNVACRDHLIGAIANFTVSA